MVCSRDFYIEGLLDDMMDVVSDSSVCWFLEKSPFSVGSIPWF